MASCDDDYPLLADQNQPPHHHHHHHHHHQSFDSHRFSTPKPPPPPQPLIAATGSPKKITGTTSVVIGDGDDEYADTGFCSQSNAKCSTPAFHDMNPFSTQEDGNPFSADEESDPNKSKAEKRKDHDELSDGGSSFYYKKPKSGAGGTSASGGEYRVEYRGDYRKDREEWSDTAIGSLLDAYTEKFFQLNRGNLRGRDWEEVASVVSDRCDKQKASKSVEQCKNKVDNLKKRYKVERHRMSESGSTVSHWPWFKKMEQIVSSSALTTKAVSDDDRSGGGTSGDLHRQSSKRYTISTPSSVSLANNTKHKSLSNPKWRRVVFKVSGAALSGSGPEKIDPKVAMLIAREVSMACCLGVQVAIVVGGRNFFCGDSWVASTGLDRSTAYQIGMMATVMNSTLLQSALEKLGVQARVQTAFPMQEIAEPYSKHRAIRHLEKGRVVIFGGVAAGTGNPLFTTDTAAALRASELNADAVLKGTNVDGVYDCHSRNSNNVALEHISYRELVSRGVTSMDMMAITLCEENGIPVVVFNLLEPGNISRALCGNPVGTLIDQSGSIG